MDCYCVLFGSSSGGVCCSRACRGAGCCCGRFVHWCGHAWERVRGCDVQVCGGEDIIGWSLLGAGVEEGEEGFGEGEFCHFFFWFGWVGGMFVVCVSNVVAAAAAARGRKGDGERWGLSVDGVVSSLI